MTIEEIEPAKEETKYLHTNECPTCFLLSYNSKPEAPTEKSTNSCDWCAANPNPPSYDLLQRKLEVLDNTTPSRFPSTLHHLLEHITLNILSREEACKIWSESIKDS